MAGMQIVLKQTMNRILCRSDSPVLKKIKIILALLIRRVYESKAGKDKK